MAESQEGNAPRTLQEEIRSRIQNAKNIAELHLAVQYANSGRLAPGEQFNPGGLEYLLEKKTRELLDVERLFFYQAGRKLSVLKPGERIISVPSVFGTERGTAGDARS